MTPTPTPDDFTPPEIEEIAGLLPAYEILSFIAKGGMGAVYLARQKSLDREVAIKILPRQYGADASFRASFQAEAKSMAKFNHPNLIGIYDFGQVDGLLYIIMEMVHGESLYHYSYGKTIDPEEASRIIIGICKGLSSAHSHGILHRDIKPANILLGPKASPKIGDFGLARPVGDHESDSAFGTPGYTAPEVMNDPSAVDQSTDIYSVGVMLYELLTGALPDNVYTPASTIAKCDARFDQIIRKATHPTPTMRYRSADDMADELEKVCQQNSSNRLLTRPATHSNNRNALAVPAAAGSRPGLQASAAGSRARSTPASVPPPKVGSNVPFIRNVIIIIGLLAAIYIAWESLKAVRAERAAENDLVKQQDEEKQKKREEKAKAALANAPKRVQPTPPVKKLTPPPVKEETPWQTLMRLRPKLAQGMRSEMPKGTFTRDGRARMYIRNNLTWHQAQNFCARHGGYIAVLPTEADLQWLCGKLESDQKIWLGAGSAGDGQWRWVDGTPWNQEIRSTSKAAYVAVDDTSILEPVPATAKRTFFIEWNMDGTNPGTVENQLKRCAESIANGDPQYPAGTTSYDNRHYLLLQKRATWQEAQALAEIGGATLAVPSNPDENVWLVEFVAAALGKGEVCWIGGHRPPNGSWQWANGEAWEFANWNQGAPNAKPTIAAGCAITANQNWNDFPASGKSSHLIIEWSQDGEGNEEVADIGDGNDQLTPLRQKCAALIKDIQQRYDKEYSNNIKGYEQELRAYERSLSKSVAEAVRPGLAIMTSRYPGNRIPADIPRANMPAKVTEILDSRINRQTLTTAKYAAEIQSLSEKYRANLEKIAQELSSKGLKSHLTRVRKEITKSHSQPLAFEKYILNSQ